VRFQTVVGWPAARKARERARPMAPRPRTVTGEEEGEGEREGIDVMRRTVRRHCHHDKYGLSGRYSP
jgi:hypothetical protein